MVGPLGPAPAFDIAAAATALFDAVSGYLTDDDTFEFPARVGMVPGGTVAWDAEELVLVWVNMVLGQPGQPMTQSPSPYQQQLFYQFSFVLLRQVAGVTGRGAQGGIPTEAQLQNDFITLAADARSLLQAVMNVKKSYVVVPSNVPFFYGPISSVGPEGGLAGCEMPVYFQAGQNPALGY